MLNTNSTFKKTTAAALAALTVFVAMPEAQAKPDRDYWYGGRGDYWRDRDDWRHDRNHRRWDNRRYTTVVVAPAPVYQPYYYDDAYYAEQPRMVTSRCVDEYNPAGLILGGAAGSLVGTQIGRGNGRTAAIISGALIGGLLGNQYTNRDRYCTYEVFNDGPIGVPTQWRNPETGYDYVVTPTREFERGDQYCREYQATTRIGGKPRESYGTACQQPDGSWKIVS